jgi:hypothetical protein
VGRLRPRSLRAPRRVERGALAHRDAPAQQGGAARRRSRRRPRPEAAQARNDLDRVLLQVRGRGRRGDAGARRLRHRGFALTLAEAS